MRNASVFLALYAATVTVACTGALAGGTFNFGHEDNRVAGAKLYDQHCGTCHDPKAGTDEWHAKKAIKTLVPAPDLLSATYRDTSDWSPYRREVNPPDADWNPNLMAANISWVCRHVQMRWPNGDRIVENKVGQTLDGLPIYSIVPHGSDFPVVVMPLCNLSTEDFATISQWIVCKQYPGTSQCRSKRG